MKLNINLTTSFFCFEQNEMNKMKLNINLSTSFFFKTKFYVEMNEKINNVQVSLWPDDRAGA